MAFCSKCGAQIAEGAQFCASCGTPVGGSAAAPSTKSSKDGEVIKCPSCGAPVGAFDIKCSECGHELRNRSASNSVTEFFQQYSKAAPGEKANIVRAFPVPNTKEDIFTFLTMGIGNTVKLSADEKESYILKRNAWTNQETYDEKLHYRENEIAAWQAKAEQAIEMGKMLFTDAASQALFQKYEKELKGNSKKHLSKQARTLLGLGIGFGIFILLCIILPLSLSSRGGSNVEKEIANETTRLDSLVVEVNTAIENKDYDIARVKAAQLVWQYDTSGWDGGKRSQANKETWDQKRELLLQELERLQGKK
ncbi:hypothetical protein FACS1894130_10230 [Spirochaetia bacterium]|nr:hypothetical protein FACS1894130_10230 [Spirochaetia bacterium]